MSEATPQPESRERGAMVKLCGLWLGRTKDGRQYLSGGATYSSRFMVFQNSFKAKAEDPDYVIYLAERQHEQKDGETKEELAAPAPTTSPAPATSDAAPEAAQKREDDIPF